jgi:hypothetical protein
MEWYRETLRIIMAYTIRNLQGDRKTGGMKNLSLFMGSSHHELKHNVSTFPISSAKDCSTPTL